MKKYAFALLAATGLLASCAKETLTDSSDSIYSGPRTVLTVNIPESAKTVMGGSSGSARPVYWSNGDKLCCNGVESDALADIAAESTSATFSFDGLLKTPYNILYPSSIWSDATHVTLPAVQSYRAGGFAEGMFPMAGYSADGLSLSINHLCSIVKISVKRETDEAAEARGGEVDTDKISCVRFKGRNGEQVSGTFGISFTTPALETADGTGTSLEVRVSKSLATSTGSAIDYYIVVPAREYVNGFDIIVQDASGHIMTKSKSSGETLVAGALYSLPEFAFVPTGTELGVEISNDEELVAFAAAYNNNEYESLGSQLMVTITDDITFDETSSAAFNATGGIGTSDNGKGGTNYFNGSFNGASHTISGLEATVPLFACTGSAGTVKDLTLDNSCSFTFSHSNTADGEFGSVAGYHKGTLDNVKVAADVSLAAVADVAHQTTLGGLIGRATTGKIQNGCEYSGLISTPSGFTTASTQLLIIGGLVGQFTNAGIIADSNFKGAISNEARQTAPTGNVYTPNLIIGGIVGHLNGGASVTSCTTTSDHTGVGGAGDYSSNLAQIVNKTILSHNSVVGGIVGELENGTLSGCTNGAIVFCTIFRNTQLGARYMKTGGIAGRNLADGTISQCTNNGKTYHRSNPRIQYLGGIAGTNSGTISGCTNNAELSFKTSSQNIKAGRQAYLGGIIGDNESPNISNVHNTGNLELGRVEDGSDIDVCLGGYHG